MSRRLLLLVLLGAGLAVGASIIGPVLALPNLDESQFPAAGAALQGALVYGTDAGSIYVYNGSTWTPLAGTPSVDIFGGDYKQTGYRRCFVTSWGSNEPRLALGIPVPGGTIAYGGYDAGLAYSSTARTAISNNGTGPGQQGLGSNTSKPFFFGTDAGEGGFTFWARVSVERVNSVQQLYVGLGQDNPASSGTLDEIGPIFNTATTQARVMFVCNPIGGTVGNAWRICGGRSRTAATCTATGFSCADAGTFFDLIIEAEPAISAAQFGAVTYTIRDVATGQSQTGVVPDVPDGGFGYLAIAGQEHTATGQTGIFGIYQVCGTTRY